MGGFKPDKEQAEAVSHFKGPALVLAPPGSGKTAVLTLRIAELVSARGVSPESVLVITFTKDAAASMEKRFRDSYPDINGILFATFHSFYYNILRSSGRITGSKIIFEKQRIPYIKRAVAEENIRIPLDNETYVSELSSYISYFLNTGSHRPGGFFGIEKDDMERIIKRYQMIKLLSGVVDFDDMIYRTYYELLENRELCEKYKKRFQFILVDEAQDMNNMQYSILKLILGEEENLFMVGDDDQSIYGFRGADPSLLFDFQSEFENIKIYYLKTNYRCDRNIIALSNSLIACNKMRYEKQMIASSKNDGRIFLIESKDAEDEAEKIAFVIGKMLEAGTKPEEIAVLYRKSSLALMLLSRLIRMGIPVFTKDEFNSGYDNFIRRDIMTYLKLAAGGGKGKREDFLRIINRPGRSLNSYLFPEEDVVLEDIIRRAASNEDRQRLMSFQRDLRFISTLSPEKAVSYIRKAAGYERYLKYLEKRYHKDPDEMHSMLEDVRQEAQERLNLNSMLSEYENRLEEIALFDEEKDQKKSPEGKISFHTFHASKGLEFDKVFMIGCCDGDTPSSKADTPETLEEERRMFYVSMTRAKHELYISLAGRRANRILYPSRFIRECGLRQG